jgi:hypothetical protein
MNSPIGSVLANQTCMMKTRLASICFLLAAALLPGQTMAFKYVHYSRETSSWAEKYDSAFDPESSEAEVLINKRDCQENVWFKFQVSGLDPASERATKLFFHFSMDGSDCKNVDNDSSCARVESEDNKNFTTPYTVEEMFGWNGEERDCNRTSGSIHAWASLQNDESSTANATWAEPSSGITIKWDFTPPAPPGDLKATPGSKKVNLEWSMDIDEDVDDESEDDTDDTDDEDDESSGSTSDIDELRVLYWSGGASRVVDVADSGVDPDAGVGLDLSDDFDAGPACPDNGFQAGQAYLPEQYEETIASQPTKESFTVKGLENGKPYQFGLVAADSFKNFSVISEYECTTPSETANFLDFYAAAGGKTGDFCFVATAVYGSYDHPIVKILRKFRDEFILEIPGGKVLVDAYYAAGPKLASWVAGNELLKNITRGTLALVAVATLPFSSLGPLGTLLFGLVCGVLIVRRRRSR